MGKSKRRAGRGMGFRPAPASAQMTMAKRSHIMNDGYQMGLLVAAAVLGDKYDYSGEELGEFIKSCDVLMYSITQEVDDWRLIRRNLEQLTGVRLNFHYGGGPQDGRYDIVDQVREAKEGE